MPRRHATVGAGIAERSRRRSSSQACASDAVIGPRRVRRTLNGCGATRVRARRSERRPLRPAMASTSICGMNLQAGSCAATGAAPSSAPAPRGGIARPGCAHRYPLGRARKRCPADAAGLRNRACGSDRPWPGRAPRRLRPGRRAPGRRERERRLLPAHPGRSHPGRTRGRERRAFPPPRSAAGRAPGRCRPHSAHTCRARPRAARRRFDRQTQTRPARAQPVTDQHPDRATALRGWSSLNDTLHDKFSLSHKRKAQIRPAKSGATSVSAVRTGSRRELVSAKSTPRPHRQLARVVTPERCRDGAPRTHRRRRTCGENCLATRSGVFTSLFVDRTRRVGRLSADKP